MTTKQKHQLIWGGLFVLGAVLLYVLLMNKGTIIQTPMGDVQLPTGASGVPDGTRGYTSYNMPGYSPPTVEGDHNSIYFPPPGYGGSGNGDCGCNSCCKDTNALQPGVPYWAALVYGG